VPKIVEVLLQIFYYIVDYFDAPFCVAAGQHILQGGLRALEEMVTRFSLIDVLIIIVLYRYS